MKIGLFFGSFNPIHVGHLLLATYLREAASLDEIWFIVSPLNPFKINGDLIDENLRLEMVKLAVGDNVKFKVSDVEFNLPKPSYTADTLKYLTQKNPDYKFNVIIGADNYDSFKDWKDSEWIRSNYPILIYNRMGKNEKECMDENYTFYKLPVFDISSTEIRNRIKNNLPILYFVPESVEQFIKFHDLYNA
jgi:nicotinate-nucleotide adenylyltransferase